MQSEVSGVIPRAPWDYCGTIVNRAVLDAYRQNLWSFLTFESNWTSPGWIQTGTVLVTQGSNVIQFDPMQATPAINAIGFQPSPVTKRQFRVGVGTIYNIWQYVSISGTVNTNVLGAGAALPGAGLPGSFLPGFGSPTLFVAEWTSGGNFLAGMNGAWNGFQLVISGVQYTIVSVPSPTTMYLTSSAGIQVGANFQIGGIATLDRPYQEPSGAAVGYSIFQCYYASPVQDFKGWAAIRDMINYNDLFFHQSRAWVDIRDPQRTWYQIPTHVVYYQNDMNPQSSTFGWPMFELWGPPTYVLTYQLYGYRKGFTTVNGIDQALVNPADSLPSALGEDCVMAKARSYAYAWAEANRQKGDVGNFLQLKREDEAEFKRLYRDYRRDDMAMVNAFHTKFRRSRAYPNQEGSFNSFSGIANPGSPL
jgi:hypothetical protein